MTKPKSDSNESKGVAKNDEVVVLTHTQTELQKFSPVTQAIASYKEKYLPLKIDGVKDKEGYKAVHEARIIVRDARTSVDKTRKSLTADARSFVDAVNEEAKRITAELAPIEEHLTAQETAIDEEIERIKQEEKQKEEQRVQGRVLKLLSLGLAFDGANYWYADKLKISSLAVKQNTDQEIEKFTEQVMELKELEKEEQEKERLRLAQEEADRLAEIKRLEDQKAEQDRKEQELKDRLAELERRENELKEAEAKRLKERNTMRVAMLQNQLEWKQFEMAYRYGSITVKVSDIVAMSDEDYEKLVKETLSEIDRIKKLEAEENRRRKVMADLGLTLWDGERFCFRDINFHWTELAVMTDDEFTTAVQGASKRKDQILKEDAEKALAEAKKAEDELKRKQKEKEDRKLARRPDRVKMEEYLKNLLLVPIPTVKPEFSDILAYMVNQLRIINDTTVTLMNKLDEEK